MLMSDLLWIPLNKHRNLFTSEDNEKIWDYRRMSRVFYIASET